MLAHLTDSWAITPEALRALHARAAVSPSALQARDARAVDFSQFVTMRGDVAILHVKGVLGRYHDWFVEGPSYGELRKAHQSLLDSGARAALLVTDSPGGDVNGLLELAEAFYAGRAKIPNTACYISGSGASAAYFLSAAFGKVYCSATASVGSIGVITSLIDDSAAQEEAGLKEFEIVSSCSPKKSQQPGDSAYRARVQQRIDDTADVLVRAVARYRGTKTSTVLERFGQGDVLIGQRAVDAGLADGVSDVETVIAELQARIDGASLSAFNGRGSTRAETTNTRGNFMAKIETPATPQYTGRDQCASCKVSLSIADVRFCSGCRRKRDSDTAARDAGLDITKYCSGCATKLAKDDDVYCAPDSVTDKQATDRGNKGMTYKQGRVAAKTEARRIKLGMGPTASAADVKTAWKARKQAKRTMKARALGLPGTASKAEIKAAKVARTAAAAPAPKPPVAKMWDPSRGRYMSADEMAALGSSNSADQVAKKLAELRAKVR
jgi:ClpP class serine protease